MEPVLILSINMPNRSEKIGCTTIISTFSVIYKLSSIKNACVESGDADIMNQVNSRRRKLLLYINIIYIGRSSSWR